MKQRKIIRAVIETFYMKDNIIVQYILIQSDQTFLKTWILFNTLSSFAVRRKHMPANS